MNLPTISVISPSYNQGEFLEETILSVLGQNYPNLEYIIIDGGSSDNSVEIIKKYQKEIHYWESVKDQGQSNAINKGFKHATGNILMWLNSDDLLMPNVLSYIARVVIEQKDGFYFGNCIRFREKETGLQCLNSDVVAEDKKLQLEQIDYIFQSSSFWTRKVWEVVGELNEQLHYGFDWEWFLRVKRHGIKMTALNKCLSLYRLHDKHKTGKGGRERQDELLKIYQTYNPIEAKLYADLITQEEDWGIKEIYKAILLKRLYMFRKMQLSEEKILKLIKPKKYKQYSELEINSFRRML